MESISTVTNLKMHLNVFLLLVFLFVFYSLLLSSCLGFLPWNGYVLYPFFLLIQLATLKLTMLNLKKK